MSQPLPDGFRAVLDPKVLRLRADRLLIGGSPLTVLRLSQTTAPYLDDDRVTVVDAASALLADRLVATNVARPDLDSLPPVAAHEITVVVPVRDRPEQLDRCLAALRPLTAVVVDDASHDPAAVAAVARRHRATLVALEVNAGPAAARNAGLNLVTSPTVAFVDSDVEVTADSLLLLSRHLADPAVALVGPRVVGYSRSHDPVGSSGTTPLRRP